MGDKRICPAFDFGKPAQCRTCIWTGGGASDLCVAMLKNYQIKISLEHEKKRAMLLLQELGEARRERDIALAELEKLQEIKRYAAEQNQSE